MLMMHAVHRDPVVTQCGDRMLGIDNLQDVELQQREVQAELHVAGLPIIIRKGGMGSLNSCA